MEALGPKMLQTLSQTELSAGLGATAPPKAPKSELMVRTFANFGSTLGGPK